MKKLTMWVAAAVIAAPLLAQNVPARVAVVDVQRVLTTSVAGKAAYERLKKLQDDRIAKAQAMNDEITKLESDINTRKLSLSEDNLTEMQKQLSDKKISMQRYAQDADRYVQDNQQKALAELEGKIKPVIDALGKEMGLAAIFNKYESGLVYASEAIDITDTIIKRFDAATAGAAK